MDNSNPSGRLAGHRYFLVGIGGSGMLPLAVILASRGASVAGSDRSLDQARLPAKFDYLRGLGIALHPQDGSGIVAPDQIVVASAAIEPSVPDIAAAEAIGCRRRTRAEMLAELFNAAPISIGVAGTSGKSTVTGMIAWMLHAAGLDPTVMNGAVMKNFAGSAAPFASALAGGGDIFVSEVDESDGSIALYRPTVAVLNNVSLDHKGLDELRQLFGDFIDHGGWAVVNEDDTEAAALLAARDPGLALTCSVGGAPAPGNLVANDLVEERFAVSFELIDGTMPMGRVRLSVPGRHNVANALAALNAVAAAGAMVLPEAMKAIEGFAGLRRRFDLVGAAGGVTVIDDFAHNPDKIAATLATLHAHPGRLIVLFQPHGFGPLKVMRRELVAAFAEGLSPDDVLILPDPVYHGGTVAREVTSADIAADIAAARRDARHIADRADAAAAIAGLARAGDRVVVMGARDDTLSQVAADILTAIAKSAEADAGDAA